MDNEINEARPEILDIKSNLPGENNMLPVPASIPEKFWDAEKGTIRLEMLLKSYKELEKKLASMIDAGDTAKMRTALGVPEKPDDYCIACDHGLFEADNDLNGKLHEYGFTKDQAQLVYDMAAEKLVPMIMDVAAEFQAEREMERIAEAFGGPDKWREISRQLSAWGKKNLPEPALNGLAASYEGVMALFKMMQADDPKAIQADGATGVDMADLQSLMRDPKYWRQKDPATIQKVTDGFKRLYG